MLHVCTSVHAEMCTKGGTERVSLCSTGVVRHSLGTVPSTDGTNYLSTAEPLTQAEFQRKDADLPL